MERTTLVHRNAGDRYTETPKIDFKVTFKFLTSSIRVIFQKTDGKTKVDLESNTISTERIANYYMI